MENLKALLQILLIKDNLNDYYDLKNTMHNIISWYLAYLEYQENREDKTILLLQLLRQELD